MKFRLGYSAFIASILLLQSCGGGSMVSGGTKDKDPLTPIAEPVTEEELPRPSETAAVITTDSHDLLAPTTKQKFILRGANLRYGDNPNKNFDGISAIQSVGSNVVRLQVYETTTDRELESALAKILEQKMIAIISLAEKEPKGAISCTEDDTHLMADVKELWLKKWVPVLAQDRFQGNVMINIADGWGVMDVFNLESTGYDTYIDTYKALIRKFRDAGFKWPLVIDAPNCGQDYFAFLNGRSQVLLTADKEKNLVFSVQADGPLWNSQDKIISAATALGNLNVPYIMSSFAGSETGEKPINQSDIMMKGLGDAAVSLNLPWATDADTAAYSMSLAQPVDLRGASVGAKVYIDKAYLEKVIVPIKNYYVPTGKMTIALYLTDTNGNRLRAGVSDVKSLNGDAWNSIKYTVKEVDPANLLEGSTNFDLKSVAKVGFQVMANGKPATVKAEIKFDDLTLFPGVPPMYDAGFDVDNEGWGKSWGGIEVGHSDGVMTLMPAGDTFGINVQTSKAPKVNPAKTLDVNVKMYIPAEYAGDLNAMGMEVFGQFGSGWETFISLPTSAGQFKTGQWIDVKTRVDFASQGKDISVFQAFGLKFTGITGGKSEPIKIDAITIQDPDAKATTTVTATQYAIKFNSTVEGFSDNGWDGSKGTLTAENGELVLTPDWTGGHNLAIGRDMAGVQEIDLSGPFRIKAKIFIPDTYASVADSSYFQFYMQDGSWGWIGIWVGNLNQFVLGQWNDIDVAVSFPEGANRSARPNRFGFQIGGDNLSTAKPAGAIKLDDIQFIGNKEVENSQPLANITFESAAQQDAFKFDFAGGSFTEAGLSDAKKVGFKVYPFSWMAATWIGSPGASLDLSTDVKTVDLTPRGEEVVNGPYGIKASMEYFYGAAPQ